MSGNNNEKMKIPETLFDTITELYSSHSPKSNIYQTIKPLLNNLFKSLFSSVEAIPIEFPNYGVLTFPYRKMGAVDTIDYFGIDELIIYTFYLNNKKNYNYSIDAGANIGLHSIFMDRCGWKVKAFEPDIQQFNWQTYLFNQNFVENVQSYNSALSSKQGVMEFTRVLGNTTSSHLTGAKPNPYGDLEKFEVNVESFYNHAENADLCKMDIEGHEKEIIVNMPLELFEGLDIILEVGSKENAIAIFKYISKSKINMFSQINNWNKVKSVNEMPFSYKDGSLFITCKDHFPITG